ncbi:MAG: FHA domain-containing protein [Anaerolineales bacterium]
MYAVKIIFMSGPDDGTEVWLRSNQSQGYAVVDGWAFVIGRRETCDLSIPFDTQVSREHARLLILQNEMRLQDNGSRNGTFIENMLVHDEAPVQLGQLFRIGRTWLRVEESQQ